MGRQEAVARSIAKAIVFGVERTAKSPISFVLNLFSRIFALYGVALNRTRPADFAKLRGEKWGISDEEYLKSFKPEKGKKLDDMLSPVGDMGLSGSTFYATADQKFLVKSVPRHSEHTFFRNDLFVPYLDYMSSHPSSLLVRICDSLVADGASLGRLFQLAPPHHIVMENIMHGREEAKSAGKPDWEHWDLKPTSYFYPERDIADGRLASEATKSQLADEFDDKIVLSKKQANNFLKALEIDTKLLAEHNAVDYSLFLVRMKMESWEPPQMVATGDPTTSQLWRTGVPSSDGEHVYRGAILDFFWAKHKAKPMAMTMLVRLWNKVTSNKHGHMSITTSPDEYRSRTVDVGLVGGDITEGYAHKLRKLAKIVSRAPSKLAHGMETISNQQLNSFVMADTDPLRNLPVLS
ncbi:hypothetical protein MKZ38_003787 [Zalerion maritima]|uniref:PIPK domain-containing protein n=1 Tax=Zalerion maritima TaxID=339359 RepID=A0AAD5RNN8_9PEZI|nr:hypothetical protein MKZ38_003787 [Zalerion maritima]